MQRLAAAGRYRWQGLGSCGALPSPAQHLIMSQKAFEMEPAAPEGTSKRDAHKTRSVVLVNIASVLEK